MGVSPHLLGLLRTKTQGKVAQTCPSMETSLQRHKEHRICTFKHLLAPTPSRTQQNPSCVYTRVLTGTRQGKSTLDSGLSASLDAISSPNLYGDKLIITK